MLIFYSYLDRKNANFLVKVDEVPVEPSEEPVLVNDVQPVTDDSPVLIHLTQSDAPVQSTDHDAVPPASVTVPSKPPSPTTRRTFTIAAIDNGLAFPFKHPGEIRSCKYT